jgi:hypothetical protein
LLVATFSIYGVISIPLFYLVWIFTPVFSPGLKPILVACQEFLYAIAPAMGLAWADSSIRVGRRLDPLLRDTFGWSRMRLVLWPSMAVSNLAFLAGGGLTTSIGQLGVVGLVCALILLGVSVVVVFGSARRTADRNYRRSLKWFVAFLGIYLIFNVGFINMLLVSPTGSLFLFTTANLVWGIVANLAIVPVLFFCLYRCSRSLVPLNRIALADSTPGTN